jgi:hypothetical protein
MANVRTSQETHYVTATEPNRLMRSIGFRRWYNNITITILGISHRPIFYLKHAMVNVRTSQETHYVTATEVNAIYRF